MDSSQDLYNELREIIAKSHGEIMRHTNMKHGYRDICVKIEGREALKLRLARLYKVGNELRYHDERV